MSSHRSLDIVPRLAGCAALVAAVAGCNPCLGTERTQATLTASFSGPPVMSSTRSAFEDGVDADFAAWRTAVANASNAPAKFGVVALEQPEIAGDPRQTLLVALPFPLARGQSIAIASSVATNARGTFVLVGPDDPNPIPSGAVGLWLLSGSTRDDLLADRAQSATGTVTVSSVSPLRIHLTATVSYSAAIGRADRIVDGDVAFSVGTSAVCAD